MKKKGFIRNILDDLLGVDADKAHDTENGEMEALTKITHRRKQPSDEETVPSQAEADRLDMEIEDLTTVGLSGKPQASPETEQETGQKPAEDLFPPPAAETQKSTVIPLRKEAPPRSREAKKSKAVPQAKPRSSPKTGIAIMSFLQVVQLGRKTCTLAINLDDWEHTVCTFKNGVLQDDFFVLDTDEFLENGQTPAKSVLLVDDDKTQIATLASELQAYQNTFSVQTAVNGKQAVRILETKPIDLLVTGLKMDEMDGFELLNYMKARFPNVPCLVISIYDFPEMHRRLDALGAVKHLIKPFETFELADTITEIFDQRTGKHSVKGINLLDFLGILQIDQKTLDIEITKPHEGACLCRVIEGNLVGIDCGGVKGKEAAQILTGWNNLSVSLTSSHQSM